MPWSRETTYHGNSSRKKNRLATKWWIVYLFSSQVLASFNDTGPSSNLVVTAGGSLDDPSTFFLGYSNDPWGTSSMLLEAETQFLQELDASHTAKRSKRGVLHLYNMVLCATGCDPLAFKGYGCYCGFLGSGYTVDGIDRCCKMHDWCYHTASCPMYLEYFVPYLWKCYRRRPLCALEQDTWSDWGICAQRLCECDRQLAECLRRYPCPRTKAVCTSSPWRLLQNVFML
ncbi:phospholipase A2 A2-actitoxin-Ucs2a [Cryptotermes secundus]|uniref:phospholipase A2 A2-actitoxin-Ucs2a n=1 Tax=Cryptotermes secundus TaxID=105785 RepID=UPI000CD7AC36|nr:phospholipase A2 A2-actitoxin-Ucs2a [Cryptotermes secundus]